MVCPGLTIRDPQNKKSPRLKKCQQRTVQYKRIQSQKLPKAWEPPSKMSPQVKKCLQKAVQCKTVLCRKLPKLKTLMVLTTLCYCATEAKSRERCSSQIELTTK